MTSPIPGMVGTCSATAATWAARSTRVVVTLAGRAPGLPATAGCSVVRTVSCLADFVETLSLVGALSTRDVRCLAALRLPGVPASDLALPAAGLPAEPV